MGKKAIKDKFGWFVAIVAFVMIAVFKWNAVWAVVFAIAAGLTAVFAGKITGKKEKSGETGERGTEDRDTRYRGGSHDTEEQGGDNT